MEHLDGFLALGGRDLNSNFTKSQKPGKLLRGGAC